jgi:hypothetical protein
MIDDLERRLLIAAVVLIAVMISREALARTRCQ